MTTEQEQQATILMFATAELVSVLHDRPDLVACCQELAFRAFDRDLSPTEDYVMRCTSTGFDMLATHVRTFVEQNGELPV